jgi:hypothetical protein
LKVSRSASPGGADWSFIGSREAGQKAAILYTIVEKRRRRDGDTRGPLELAPT